MAGKTARREKARAQKGLPTVVEAGEQQKSDSETSEEGGGEARGEEVGEGPTDLVVGAERRFAVRAAGMDPATCTDGPKAKAATAARLKQFSDHHFEELVVGERAQGLYILTLPMEPTPESIATLLAFDAIQLGLDGMAAGVTVSNEVPVVEILEDAKVLTAWTAQAVQAGERFQLTAAVEANLFRTSVVDPSSKVTFAFNATQSDLEKGVARAVADGVKFKRFAIGASGSAHAGRLLLKGKGAERVAITDLDLTTNLSLWVGGFDELDVCGPESIGQVAIRKITGALGVVDARAVKKFDYEVFRFQLKVPLNRKTMAVKALKELAKGTAESGDRDFKAGGEIFTLWFATSTKMVQQLWMERGGGAAAGGGGGAAQSRAQEAALARGVAAATAAAEACQRNAEQLEQMAEVQAQTPEMIKQAVAEQAAATRATQEAAATAMSAALAAEAKAASDAIQAQAKAVADAQVKAAADTADAQVKAAQATADALAAEATARVEMEKKQDRMNGELAAAQAEASRASTQAAEAQAEASRMAQQLMRAICVTERRLDQLADKSGRARQANITEISKSEEN